MIETNLTSQTIQLFSLVKSNQHQEYLREQDGNRPGNSSGALRPNGLDVRKSDFETRFLFLFNDPSLPPLSTTH